MPSSSVRTPWNSTSSSMRNPAPDPSSTTQIDRQAGGPDGPPLRRLPPVGAAGEGLTYFLLTLVAAFWGGSFVAAKVALRDFSPVNLVTVRFLLASLIFLPIIWRCHRRGERIERRDWPMVIFLSWLGVTFYFIIQYTGLSYTTASHSTLIITTNPLFTALFSWFLLRERLTPARGAGILTALTGVLWIVWPRGGLSGWSARVFIGDLLILSNAICWALYSTLGRGITRKYSPLLVTSWIGVIGAVSLLPIALPSGFPAQVVAAAPLTWAMVVFLAALCSGAGYLIWYSAVARVGATRTAVFLYLEPVVAMLIAVPYLGESVTWSTLLGGALTVAGVYLTTRS